MRTPAFLVTSLITSSFLLAQSSSTLNVDPASAKVLWTATKVTGTHAGGVPVAAGTLTIADKELKGATITMDMTGLTCLDIEAAGPNAKLVGHLKGEDFFHVEKYATAMFSTSSIEKIADAVPGKPNYRVTGDLTIKGITHPNTFDCLFWMEGGTARAAASIAFDRGKYDITYRSGTFFPEIGDKAISDTVSLTFDISAK